MWPISQAVRFTLWSCPSLARTSEQNTCQAPHNRKARTHTHTRTDTHVHVCFCCALVDCTSAAQAPLNRTVPNARANTHICTHRGTDKRAYKHPWPPLKREGGHAFTPSCRHPNISCVFPPKCNRRATPLGKYPLYDFGLLARPSQARARPQRVAHRLGNRPHNAIVKRRRLRSIHFMILACSLFLARLGQDRIVKRTA